MAEFILASGSPRRREILTNIGLSFTVEPSGADETIPEGMTPELAVEYLAMAKCGDVAKRAGRGKIVIGADTVVVLDGKILGKPADEADAERMLRSLSGREHSVLTGLALIRTDDAHGISVCERTAVEFRDISDEEIEAYIATGEPMDKAGAYGIQGLGGIFVRRVVGDFQNVVGLPAARLAELLAGEFGYNLLLEGKRHG